MTFDVTGLLIFLLAIVPGFLAQQARTLLIPRSLRTQSVLEETGNYVLNSILVHLFLLASFRVVLGCFAAQHLRRSVSLSSKSNSAPGPGSTDISLLPILLPVSYWDLSWESFEELPSETAGSEPGSPTIGS